MVKKPIVSTLVATLVVLISESVSHFNEILLHNSFSQNDEYRENSFLRPTAF
jgi:hypothetical protein